MVACCLGADAAAAVAALVACGSAGGVQQQDMKPAKLLHPMRCCPAGCRVVGVDRQRGAITLDRALPLPGEDLPRAAALAAAAWRRCCLPASRCLLLLSPACRAPPWRNAPAALQCTAPAGAPGSTKRWRQSRTPAWSASPSASRELPVAVCCCCVLLQAGEGPQPCCRCCCGAASRQARALPCARPSLTPAHCRRPPPTLPLPRAGTPWPTTTSPSGASTPCRSPAA